MISILTEPAYGGSIWCKELLKSLTDTLRQKRLPFCEAYCGIENSGDGVFIIASDYSWIKNTVTRLNAAGIKPILICNQSEQIQGCDYSCVCSDINGSMKYLINELKSAGKTRVALYGVNTRSISDISRVDGLFTFKDESFNKMRVFTNNGSLKNCFDEFFKECESFDAVICSNDFAAVSLVRSLAERDPKSLERLKILSCAKTNLTGYYEDKITSVNMNFEQYGKAAVFIYEKLKTHAYMSGMTITVKWNCANVKTTPCNSVAFEPENGGCEFYSDVEMREMLTVEQILNTCSNTDRLILTSLMEGERIDKAAERCFLTYGGVKYRIKRILSECGVESKSELLRLLKIYLPDGCKKLKP